MRYYHVDFSPVLYHRGSVRVAICLRLVPISGYRAGTSMLRFIVLPVAIGVVSGIGAGVRFYRIIFLEVIGNDYIRTARAKELPRRGCCSSTS